MLLHRGRNLVILLLVALSVIATAPASPSTAPTSQPATAPARATLTVEIKDVRNLKGQLIIGVFASADGFPTKEAKSVAWEMRPLKGHKKGAVVLFTAALPPGTYAASVLHDENNSGDMDKGLGGVPKEGYGVTNNPKPRFRAARYDEATFELPPDGARKTISVQYF